MGANEVSNLFIDNEDAFNITGNFYDDITASDMHISVSLVSGVTSTLSKEEWNNDSHTLHPKINLHDADFDIIYLKDASLFDGFLKHEP